MTIVAQVTPRPTMHLYAPGKHDYITSALEYQASDDKVCFNPARVPISFTVTLKTLDRKPAGE